MLIVGGAVLLWVDRLKLTPRHHDATAVSAADLSAASGSCQCLAMIPGVSRSGATIVSAMLLGADKRSAAEFSFYLAMPTMAGAFAYDLFKNCGQIGGSNWLIVAVGFLTSFVAAWIVVQIIPRLRVEPRLRAVRLVAHHRRLARADRARACSSSRCSSNASSTDADAEEAPRDAGRCWTAGAGARKPPTTPCGSRARRPSTACGRPARTPSCARREPDVGLPAGQMGNSEVGHLNIGAGRVVMQDLPRVERRRSPAARSNARPRLQRPDRAAARRPAAPAT